MIELKKGESVVTAFPTRVRNSVTVIIRGADDKLREESLPESMHSPKIASLYSICADAHAAMTWAVIKVLTKKSEKHGKDRERLYATAQKKGRQSHERFLG